MDNNKPQAATNIIKQMEEMVALKESFKEDQLKFVKNLINPDLTDNEPYMFLMFSNKTGLNPFNKEIIAVVYNKSEPAKRRVSIITARDGKRVKSAGKVKNLKVEAIYVKEFEVTTGRIDENQKPVYSKEWVRVKPWEGGNLWGAEASCERDGELHSVSVPLSEYDTSQNVWAGKKSTMIKKVAESQVLSMAVPELLGVYDESEMPSEARQIGASIVEGAEEPATPQLLETLKVLGAEVDDKGNLVNEYTKQGANDEILRLQTEKRVKKK